MGRHAIVAIRCSKKEPLNNYVFSCFLLSRSETLSQLWLLFGAARASLGNAREKKKRRMLSSSWLDLATNLAQCHGGTFPHQLEGSGFCLFLKFFMVSFSVIPPHSTSYDSLSTLLIFMLAAFRSFRGS